MNSKSAAVVLILLGVAFWLGSIAWNRIAGAGNLYSDEQAGEYADAAKNLHALANAGAHGDGDEDEQRTAAEELAKAKERFEEKEASRDRALARKSNVRITLQVLSTVCVILGAGMHLVQRNSDSG